MPAETCEHCPINSQFSILGASTLSWSGLEKGHPQEAPLGRFEEYALLLASTEAELHR